MDIPFFNQHNISIKKNALLSKYTTFQLGGPCPYLIECDAPEKLILTIQKLKQDDLSFVLIGGGSNIVVSDLGLSTPVVCYKTDKLNIINQTKQEISVAANSNLDGFVKYCAGNGLEGINYASGIPGTIGGAIVGNAGAFGKQIGDVLTSITLINADGHIHIAKPDELGFTYRHSLLKNSDQIVVSATLKIKQTDSKILLDDRTKILNTRKEKHPDLQTTPCAGSFFKNIEPTSKADRRQAAGWFLEEAGGKKLFSGNIHIFNKHANIIVKGNNGLAQDVYQLSKKMQKIVKDKFDLDLIREVRFCGKFETDEQLNENGFW